MSEWSDGETCRPWKCRLVATGRWLTRWTVTIEPGVTRMVGATYTPLYDWPHTLRPDRSNRVEAASRVMVRSWWVSASAGSRKGAPAVIPSSWAAVDGGESAAAVDTATALVQKVADISRTTAVSARIRRLRGGRRRSGRGVLPGSSDIGAPFHVVRQEVPHGAASIDRRPRKRLVLPSARESSHATGTRGYVTQCCRTATDSRRGRGARVRDGGGDADGRPNAEHGRDRPRDVRAGSPSSRSPRPPRRRPSVGAPAWHTVTFRLAHRNGPRRHGRSR